MKNKKEKEKMDGDKKQRIVRKKGSTNEKRKEKMRRQ